MKRFFAVALIVAAASACTAARGGTTTRGAIARQYDQQTYQTSHGDLDRAIGQR